MLCSTALFPCRPARATRAGLCSLAVAGALALLAGGAPARAQTVIDNQTVNVPPDHASPWNVGRLFVGSTGTGELNITSGGQVAAANWCAVGRFGGSQGVVTVDGSGSWTTGNDLYIGDSGNGTLTITNGGQVSNGAAHMGFDAGTQGIVTVDGTGSAWTNAGYLWVGFNGAGTLTITNGGAVSNTVGIVETLPGAANASTVTVNGSNSAWTNSTRLTVGYTGQGALTVSNGGAVSAPSVLVSDDSAPSPGQGVINIGAAQGSGAAAPGALNTATVTLGTQGALVFNHDSTNYVFAPEIDGAGAIHQVAGVTSLSVASTYTGDITILGGALSLTGSSADSATVDAGTTLILTGDQTLETLVNSGTVALDVGTTLTVDDYTGGGALQMSAQLDSGNAASVTILHSLSGSPTTVNVVNIDPGSALTSGNGILLITAPAGTPASSFRLGRVTDSAGGAITGYSYRLAHLNTGWYLQIALASAPSATPVPTLGLGALALLAALLAAGAALARRGGA